MAGTVCEGLSFAKETENYIVGTLDPVLEDMITDVVTEMPRDALEFMINWLRKRCGASAGQARLSVVAMNQKLKDQLVRDAGVLGEMSKEVTAKAGGEAKEEEEEEEEEDDDDCGDELPPEFLKSEAQLKTVRTSVSAEAYGAWNQKKEFEAPRYEKSPEQKGRLSSTLQKSFMFQELDDKDMDTIILAMKECIFTSGTRVITEGDDGNFMFIIEQGTLECKKMIDGQERTVKTCSEGDVFGELALLYNCPRAANVVAKNQCVCWQLDRDTFNHIVKEASMKRRERYDKFLQSVTLLSTIDVYERSQICDALVPQTFAMNEVVVKQDDPGSQFYIVESGTLYALKNDVRVRDYKPGDYFGELALLKNQPRAASVIVSSDKARVLSMSRTSFSKMLGHLDQLIQSRINTYV